MEENEEIERDEREVERGWGMDKETEGGMGP